MVGIVFNPDQVTDYIESELDGEVVLVNLLKFAGAGEGAGAAGPDAFARRGAAVTDLIEAQGGKVKWVGRSHHVFIGDPGVHDWDAMAVVSYPSRKTFLEMVGAATNAEEQARRATGSSALRNLSPARRPRSQVNLPGPPCRGTTGQSSSWMKASPRP